jgi:hypothetical protein
LSIAEALILRIEPPVDEIRHIPIPCFGIVSPPC